MIKIKHYNLMIYSTAILFSVLIHGKPKILPLIVRNQFASQKISYPQNFERYSEKTIILKNQKYPSKFKNNTYDIYLPKTIIQNQKSPVIVYIHGGAFVGGDKKGIEPYGTMLASNGYVVVSMNYELAPEASYPVPIIQLSELYTYLDSIKDKYSLDLSKTFFAGDSAGAQITAQFINIQINKELSEQMEIEPVILREHIKGALLYCGPYNIETLSSVKDKKLSFVLDKIGESYIGKKGWEDSIEAQQATIINYITSNFPPVYITDGNTMSFEKDGKELAEKLRELKVKVKSRFFPLEEYTTQHEFQFHFNTKASETVYEDTLSFLLEHVNEKQE